jgi:hypothetical protein
MSVVGGFRGGYVFGRWPASRRPRLDLTIVRPAANDAGLVDGHCRAVGGMPAARRRRRTASACCAWQYANEDGKVEFGVEWLTKRYDLAGYDRLYMDVFVESPDALPGLMGIWSLEWDPPDVWQPAASVPPTAGAMAHGGVRPGGAGADRICVRDPRISSSSSCRRRRGTIYVDHLRLVRFGASAPPAEVAALGFEDRNEVTWSAVPAEALTGYHVYGADAAAGPFTRLTAQPQVTARHFVEYGPLPAARYYRVTVVAEQCVESPPSAVPC